MAYFVVDTIFIAYYFQVPHKSLIAVNDAVQMGPVCT